MFADSASPSIAIHVLAPDDVETWCAGQPAFVQGLLSHPPFKGAMGEVRVIPGADGAPSAVAAGLGSAEDRRRELFPLGGLRGKLPEGCYHFAPGPDPVTLENAVLGWLLAGYRFDRYREQPGRDTRLIAPDGLDAARATAIAEGVFLTSDLINTPTSDMGPEELHAAVADLAARFGAGLETIVGDALLDRNFPLIHTVGRAAGQSPRLLDLRWGRQDAPRVTLVGKGVCFDTGGLNIKPAGSMGLMKKDMGGAATVLGLAHMIMASGLDLRLRVLIPAVENAISATAFRPGDILTSRKGLTVEINNTDAEGRLVLADALALADEESPEMLICMATLTGAARVAVGPELVPYFTDDAGLAADLNASASAVADPLWQLPLWPGYETMIEPGIADLDNAPKGGFAGAITAALFLNRFVESAGSFAHFDCYGWNPSAKPARPKGGACQGARALFDLLSRRYG